MAVAGLAIVWDKVLKIAPDLALQYGPQILKAGKDGVKFCNNFLKINDLKNKNSKQDKLIDEYCLKIGKAIYEGNIAVNNIDVKDNIERIRECEKLKNKNLDKIKEIENLMKNSKVLDDAEAICGKVYKQRQKKSDSKKKTSKKQITKKKEKK